MREFAFVIEPSRLNGVYSAFCLPFCLTIFGDFSNVRPIRFHQDEKSHGHLLYTLVVLLSFLLYRLRFTRLEHADFERLLKESRFRWLKLVELKLAWSILFRYLNLIKVQIVIFSFYKSKRRVRNTKFRHLKETWEFMYWIQSARFLN